MLKADSSSRRQLPETGPVLLWRDRVGGGREGLALAMQACANADCPCREIVIEGWSVGGELVAASVGEGKASFTYAGKRATSDEQVLVTGVDIDSGKLVPVERAPKPKAWAVEWLGAELDSELLELLRRRFAAAKTLGPPADWRKEDWSWWKPGHDVGWLDVHPDEVELEATVGETTYVFQDFYCVEPGCVCDEVRWMVWRAVAGRIEEVGGVSLNPTYPSAAQFAAHGALRQELVKAWAVLGEREPISALVFGRREKMRAVAPELHRLFGKPRATGPVGRNEPCPCGSGKKYKQCCMERR